MLNYCIEKITLDPTGKSLETMFEITNKAFNQFCQLKKVKFVYDGVPFKLERNFSIENEMIHYKRERIAIKARRVACGLD